MGTLPNLKSTRVSTENSERIVERTQGGASFGVGRYVEAVFHPSSLAGGRLAARLRGLRAGAKIVLDRLKKLL